MSYALCRAVGDVLELVARASCRPRSTAAAGTPTGAGRRYSNEKLKIAARLDAARSDVRGVAALLRELPARRSRMLKVAIVGCGKIADAHASQIRRIRRMRDRRRLRSRTADGQAVLRPVPGRPPLQRRRRAPARRPPGRRARHDAAGKPFRHRQAVPRARRATSTWRSRSRSTRRKPKSSSRSPNRMGVRITAGHDDQFSHAARRMRALVAERLPGRRARSTWRATTATT